MKAVEQITFIRPLPQAVLTKNIMCLAVPGKVISKFDAQGIRMGKMDFDGITKDICLEYVPDIEIGDYATVHVGFAMEKIDEQQAMQTLQLFRDMGFLEEELNANEDETAYSFEMPK